ncbi:MAG: tyrosine-type recombinase/integrase [Tatlockia sp.]|jgi:site-specific recombinase XerD
MKIRLLPLFDSLNNLHKNRENAVLPHPDYQNEFLLCLSFLRSYTGSLGTFTSYRRETERLLQWCWLIKQTPLATLKRDDIEQYIRFCQNPPESWISLKKVPRFIEKEGLRIPNEAWRPFVVTVSKSARKQGVTATIEQFELSQGAVQEIFAILSTLFNYLIAEEYLTANPVALMRQKSKFIRKQQKTAPVRRLSMEQWEAVLQAGEMLAMQNPEMHERTRFILSLLFGMYLRISELAASERWTPLMNHFAKDSHGHWWFTTVGKGNKERQVAVSEAMLESLIRWRKFLSLPALPSPSDNTPLLPKLRGTGPLCDTAPIRRLVQHCFDAAAHTLRLSGKTEEADNLNTATVHWLRHTGISEDVKIRPREHVRDDAGHSSSVTTDRYIDVEKQARYQTAQKKQIEPT